MKIQKLSETWIYKFISKISNPQNKPAFFVFITAQILTSVFLILHQLFLLPDRSFLLNPHAKG